MKQKKMDLTDADDVWNRIRQDIDHIRMQGENHLELPFHDQFGVRKKNMKMIFRIAAMLILTAAVSGYFFMDDINQVFTTTKQTSEYRVVSAGVGETIRIQASDGTRIILDAGSELRYPKVFKDRRDVYLEGEAYFEVVANKDVPFYVHADHALVKVVGTRFNVRSWDEAPEVSVTVMEGKVAVSNKKTERLRYLVKGEQSKIQTNGNVTEPVKVDSEKQISWMNHEIHFENASVKEVLAQLERWYGYKYSFSDTSILNQRLTVHLGEENISDVFMLIGLVTNTGISHKDSLIQFISKRR
ncbi:MAG: FecR domain-containing protein [candidate division KSB1 bacterium]|nr:FecR domain-containing protein [candidate division KSB1 bacterium]